MRTVFENKYWRISVLSDETIAITQKEDNQSYDTFVMDVNDRIINQKGKITIINKIQYLAEDR